MTISIKNILFFFIAISLIFSLSKNILDFKSKQDFSSEIQSELKKAEIENAQLKSSRTKAKDPYEVEKILRNKLNLTRPGEYILILPTPELSPSPTPTPIQQPYKQWLEVFMIQ